MNELFILFSFYFYVFFLFSSCGSSNKQIHEIISCGNEKINNQAISISESDCTVIIENDENAYYSTSGIVKGISILPGDYVCLRTGTREKSIYFNGLNGSKNNPVTIINLGGKFELLADYAYGLSIDSSNYIRVTGTGSSDNYYGISLANVSANTFGVSKDSSNIEIDHIEFTSTNYLKDPNKYYSQTCINARKGEDFSGGLDYCKSPYSSLLMKTDPSCPDGNDYSNTFNRESGYIMKNLNIHNNYFHDTNQGTYIGYSWYKGKSFNCNGQNMTLYPHDVKGLSFYNNCLKKMGQNASQFSCASSAASSYIEDEGVFIDPGIECFIYDNVVIEDSLKAVNTQRSGFTIGGGSACSVYNNVFYNGNGHGIEFLGYRGRIYNNLIINSGTKDKKFRRVYFSESDLPSDYCTKMKYEEDDSIYAIYLDEKTKLSDVFTNDPELKPLEKIEIYNNTIFHPVSGISFRNEATSENFIYNNVIVLPRSFNYDFYDIYCNWGWDFDKAIKRAASYSVLEVMLPSGISINFNGHTIDDSSDYLDFFNYFDFLFYEFNLNFGSTYNYLVQDINNTGFLDYTNLDFHLNSDSILINNGKFINDNYIKYDFDANLRDNKFDIGAYEYK